MKDWIEIFKTGTHTDASGKKKTFTEADLDRMASTYNPASHEAPAVIGHPKDNAPAWGWVEKVRREGGKLLAKFKQVQPAFADMVESGLFKKRSVSIYPDGTLRHVGFLGAQPPAVKGLADIKFSENEACETFEFEEPVGETFAPTTKKEGDMPTVEELQKKLADEKAAREKAENEAKTFKARAEGAEANFAETQKAAGKKAIADFIEAGIKEGKILPAWKAAGLGTFMEHLEGVSDGQAAEYEFSEGKGKQTPGKWFRDFILSFSEHPLFKEMTRPAEDKGAGAGADEGAAFSEPLTDRV